MLQKKKRLKNIFPMIMQEENTKENGLNHYQKNIKMQDYQLILIILIAHQTIKLIMN